MSSPRFTRQTVAKLIDHTILRADATESDVNKLCHEAATFGFMSVCVNPVWVPFAAEQLAGTESMVCTVAGFPLGANSTETKVYEAKQAVGAQEVDMVINVGRLKAGDTAYVENEIRAIADACHGRGAILKVIFETCLLTDDEKKIACEASVRAGADFVKTSTGFGKSGATTADIALMRAAVGPTIGVKASGGVRTLDHLKAMVAAGASRIGASASVAIVEAADES